VASNAETTTTPAASTHAAPTRSKKRSRPFLRFAVVLLGLAVLGAGAATAYVKTRPQPEDCSGAHGCAATGEELVYETTSTTRNSLEQCVFDATAWILLAKQQPRPLDFLAAEFGVATPVGQFLYRTYALYVTRTYEVGARQADANLNAELQAGCRTIASSLPIGLPFNR
jgi:hypothetical protein